MKEKEFPESEIIFDGLARLDAPPVELLNVDCSAGFDVGVA